MVRLKIKRTRLGKAFQYFLEDKQITDKESLLFFKSLGIPPAWTDVKISTAQGSKILATGIDKAGRLQYVYHPKFRAKQEQEKFERILHFAHALPTMRKITNEHLKQPGLKKEKVLACIVELMDEAYFRVGNEIYARENESYGITTIRSKHTTVKKDTITFDFVGKSGKKHLKEITDKKLAKIVKKLDELPGYHIFKYYDIDGDLKKVKSEDVNEYIREIMGEEFSAKDFRTWGGTLLATAELARVERGKNVRERKKTVTECIKNVAAKLGNTPAVTRSSYIDPRVINAYVQTNDLTKIQKTMQSMKSTPYFRKEESCVLRLLENARA